MIKQTKEELLVIIDHLLKEIEILKMRIKDLEKEVKESHSHREEAIE